MVAVGTGRQFISWDQGTLTRRDINISVEQSMRFGFGGRRHGPIRAPSAMLIALKLQLIFSRTPSFAIAPVSATGGPRAETDFGFLAGYVIRFRH